MKMTEKSKKTAVAIYALHHLRKWTERTVSSLEVPYDELRKEVLHYCGKNMLQSMLNAFERCSCSTDGVRRFIDVSIHWDSTVRGYDHWIRAHRSWMQEWHRILMTDVPASWAGFIYNEITVKHR